MSLCLNLLAALLLSQEAAPERFHSRSVRIVEKAGGAVELSVTESTADGTPRTSTWKAASAEEFRRKYPDQAKEHRVGEHSTDLDVFPFGLPWAGLFREWMAPAKPLGMRVTALPEALKAQLDVQGLLVADLDAEGRAAAAGLRKHDVLLKLNGAPVGGAFEFRAALRSLVAAEVRLDVLRHGKPIEITIRGSTS